MFSGQQAIGKGERLKPLQIKPLGSYFRLSALEQLAKTRFRLVVSLTLGLTATLMLLLLATSLLIEHSLPPRRFVALAGMLLTLSAAFWALRRDRLVGATLILAWGTLGSVTIQALVAGDLSNPGLFAFPMLILLAGSLLGPRHAAWLMAGELAAVALIVLASALGGIPDVAPPPVAVRGVVVMTLVACTYLALRYFLRAHHDDLEEIAALNQALQEKVDALREQGLVLQSSEAEVRALNLVLEQRVEERTQALSRALEDLQLAQQELVDAEKLAAMGTLVAGVAHELNTPIGNALASASTLGASAQDLTRCLTAGPVRRSQVLQLASRMEQAAELTERSIHRAAHLVHSFKQVAVDQASEMRRVFELGRMLADVLDMVRPSFRHKAIEFELSVEGEIQMDSFPGALSQVVMNLTMNSALHAFEGRESGLVKLTARAMPDEWVEVVCGDNGVGMEPEVLRRVFEPFFTTRMGSGGTGLGLSIARNLSAKVLGGRLEVESEPGVGTRFVLRMPLVLSSELPCNAPGISS